MIRPLLALPVIIYLWKVIVWDKVLAWGTTDPILRRCRRLGRHHPDDLCRRALAREDRQDDMGAQMRTSRSATERLATLEQKVSHMEGEVAKMAAKVDEMHAILLQARGVRWAIVAVAGLVGFLTGISHWLIARA